MIRAGKLRLAQLLDALLLQIRGNVVTVPGDDKRICGSLKQTAGKPFITGSPDTFENYRGFGI